MPRLYTIEGQVEESIDTPERIQRIKDGLWAYLEKEGALDLRWEGPLLLFRGKPIHSEYWLGGSKLCGVIAGQLSFQPENGRLLVGFCLKFHLGIGVFLIGPAWLSFPSRAKWYFKMAITRGLTEVAIKEIEDFRSRATGPQRV